MTKCKTIDLSTVTLAVLAGGSGTRMGLAKSWLQLDGKPILAWLLDRMQWPGPTLLVSAPAVVHPPGAERFDREVVDPVDGLGPLRGVLTALEHLSTSMAVILTVDMPAVKKEMLVWLVETLDARSECNGLMFRVRRDDEAQVEPFPSAFRAEAAALVLQRLNSGRRSVRVLCGEESFLSPDAPAQWSASAWINLNTPGDLAAFEASKPVRNTE